MAASSCEHFEADLSAFLDHELDAARAAEVENHLSDCKRCRLMLAELRDVAERLAALPHMPAPREISTAMRREAERRELLGNRTAAPRPRRLILFAHLSASAAVIAACLFVGWRVIQPPAESNQTRAAGPANASPRITNEPRTETNGAKKLALRDLSVESSELEAVRAPETRELPTVRADLAERAAAPSDKIAAAWVEEIGQIGSIVFEELPGGASFVKIEDRQTAHTWAQAAAPVVEIVVTPKDEASWQSTYALISKWSQPDPSNTVAATGGERAPALGLSLRKDAEFFFDPESGIAAIVATAPIHVELLVDADETGGLIARIEQGAPRQVSARLTATNVSELRRLLESPSTAGLRGGSAGGRLGVVPLEDTPADTLTAKAAPGDDHANDQAELAGLVDGLRSRSRTAERENGRLARLPRQSAAEPETASTRSVDPAAHRDLQSERDREDSRLAQAPQRDKETLERGRAGGRGRRDRAVNADTAQRKAGFAAPASGPAQHGATPAPTHARRREIDARMANRFKKENESRREEDESAPPRETSMPTQDHQAREDTARAVRLPARSEKAERFADQDQRANDRKSVVSATPRPASPPVTFRVTLLPPRKPPTTMPATTSSTRD